MSSRTVFVVLFEPLDVDRAAVGGFDWFDDLRTAQKRWREHDADNDMVDPTHRARLFEFGVNSLSTAQEITEACELEFLVDETRLVPLRDTYKDIPKEQQVVTLYRLPGNEGTVYTLRFPKGNEFSIGESQSEYHELASILDEEWVERLPMDMQTAKTILLTAELIEQAVGMIRQGKGDPLAALSLYCDELRDCVPTSMQPNAVRGLLKTLDELEAGE